MELRGRDERGQLIVVAALLIAVLFVGLALVLNSAIYAENLASRSTSEAGLCSPSDFQQNLRNEFVELIDRTNARVETTDHGQLSSTLEADLDEYGGVITRECTQRGSWADFGVEDEQNGTRLRQTNESRDFTDKNGNWNWTLTSGVPDGGQFAMAIQGTSLYENDLDTTLATLSSEAFAVEFRLKEYDGDGDGVWRVYFYQGTLSDNVYAVVERPNQTFSGLSTDTVDGWLHQTCIARGDTVSVRFGGGMYGGKPCSMFDFYDDVDAHEVSYENARVGDGLGGSVARARGGYEVLIGSTTFDESAFHPVGDGQPFHQAAITEMTYEAAVDSSNTWFAIDNTTVVPHYHDAAGILRQHPRVDRFDLTDRTDAVGDPTFDVAWEVGDGDGDLDRVELYLVHTDDEKIVDSAEYDVSGQGASGSDTLDDTRAGADDGDEYRIMISVVDESGRATTVSETHVAG